MERVANSSSRSLTGAARIAAKSFECAKHAGFEEVWNLADTGEKRLRGLSASSEKKTAWIKRKKRCRAGEAKRHEKDGEGEIVEDLAAKSDCKK